MTRLLCAAFGLWAPLLLASHAGGAEQVPAEVRVLEGSYSGSWTMFGIDRSGQVVKRMSWADTMNASGARVDGGRAYVTTVDEMRFEGVNAPPVRVEGKEGYLLNREGAPGDYFIEAGGEVHRMVRVGEGVWSYTARAGAEELARLGFPAGASGQHALVKVITSEQGVETHRISRLSTVSWKDADGKEQWLQFVSLQGFHRRER